jgi:hypothetical protein
MSRGIPKHPGFCPLRGQSGPRGRELSLLLASTSSDRGAGLNNRCGGSMQCLVARMFASLRFPTIFVLLAWAAALPATAQELSGTVKSGTVPILGATVTLYMAGYDRGIPPSVLSSAVSDASGHFVIKVPPLRANDVLYVTARGPLPSVDLAAMLGTYRNVSWFVSGFVVNELSTVATAWAMAQFMSGDDIGGKSPGLQNAAATVGNMVDVKTGTIATVLATPPNGSQPRPSPSSTRWPI